jgi:hypothetical protein
MSCLSSSSEAVSQSQQEEIRMIEEQKRRNAFFMVVSFRVVFLNVTDAPYTIVRVEAMLPIFHHILLSTLSTQLRELKQLEN